MQIGDKRNKSKKPDKKDLTIDGKSDIMGTLSRKTREQIAQAVWTSTKKVKKHEKST